MSARTVTPKPTPTSRLDGLRPYSPGEQRFEIDLRLDANEGAPDAGLLEALRTVDGETLRRYSDARALGAQIAAQWGIVPERVVVTAGGDDAIDRLIRATLEPGRSLVLHEPTFVMIPQGARLAQGEIRPVEWVDGPFPLDAFVQQIDDTTSLVSLVTPNNPTGCVIALEDVRVVIDAASRVGAVVMVDLAYAEYAREDPTRELIAYDNVVVVRTLSKAHGLAGLRVGYALCSEQVAGWLRTVGSPYPVSTLSLAVAARAIETERRASAHVQRVSDERERLRALLEEFGVRPLVSDANYVCARFGNASFVRDALASRGISVRGFAGHTLIRDCLRITLPGDDNAFARLCEALRLALAPEAVLFDLDGVLADVSGSYREAIVATARTFGVDVGPEDITRAKREGDANNDWLLTQRLVRSAGVEVSLDEVTERFQHVYLGDGVTPGLRERETLLVASEILEAIGARAKLAIVTGRPREEARWFLERAGVGDLFGAVVCMEDAPAKPSPEPVRLAMDQVGVTRAWMVGDTPDDVRSARSAGAIGIGVVAPGEDRSASGGALLASGAACVIEDIGDLVEMMR
ncbi:MAG: hypothetical protein Tsb0013_10400 [Phycisphaerales bacterium]